MDKITSPKGKMMNEKNLVPLSERPKEEAKKIQEAGGQAWKEICAKRKTMKEKLLLLLSLPSEVREGMDKETSGLIAMIEKWENTGDRNIGDFLRDTKGEKPTEKTEIVGELPPLVIRELKNDAHNGDCDTVSSVAQSEKEE